MRTSAGKRLVLGSLLLLAVAGRATAATTLRNAYVLLSRAPIAEATGDVTERIVRDAARTTKPFVILGTSVDRGYVSGLVERLDGIVQLGALQASEAQLRQIAELAGAKIVDDAAGLGGLGLGDLGRLSEVEIGEDGVVEIADAGAAAVTASARAGAAGGASTPPSSVRKFPLRVVHLTGMTREMAAQQVDFGAHLARLKAMAGQQAARQRTAEPSGKGSWYCVHEQGLCVEYTNVPRSQVDDGQCDVAWKEGPCPRDRKIHGVCEGQFPGMPNHVAYADGVSAGEAERICGSIPMSVWKPE